MHDEQRVVITGLGMVTALGPDRESTWTGIRDGRCAIRAVNLGEPSSTDGTTTRWLGAPLKVPTQSDRDPVVLLGLQVSEEALADAWLSDISSVDADRAACTLSTSKGGMRTLLAAHRRLLAGQPLSAGLFEQAHPGALALAASTRFGFRGLSAGPVAACAGGVHSLIQGYHLICEGRADVVLAGAADASLILPLMAAYDRMGVLSHQFDDPEGAVKPFDRARDGFAVGEGAAAMVLESLSAARARRRRPYAELVGWARGSDAYDLTALSGDRSQMGRLLSEALTRADVAGANVDYINAHGTATRMNDVLETAAIHEALRKAATRVPVSSTKAATGHLLGAAGAVEAGFTLLALRDSFVPPTLNLRNPDSECDLDYVPLVGRRMDVRTAVCVSAGFGGQIGIVVFRRCE